MRMEQGIIFDLENVLLTIDIDENAKNRLVYDFLRERKYLFHPDDLKGKTPLEFAASLSCWHEHDGEILEQEIGKFERKVMLEAKCDSSAPGVLSMLSLRYRLVVLSRSRGDGIVKALGNAGIRQFFDFIVPGEKWVGHPSRTVGLEFAMEKYPEISKEQWCYVGAPPSREAAVQCGLRFYAFGDPPLEELEDLMDILL